MVAPAPGGSGSAGTVWVDSKGTGGGCAERQVTRVLPGSQGPKVLPELFVSTSDKCVEEAPWKLRCGQGGGERVVSDLVSRTRAWP